MATLKIQFFLLFQATFYIITFISRCNHSSFFSFRIPKLLKPHQEMDRDSRYPKLVFRKRSVECDSMSPSSVPKAEIARRGD